MSWKVTDVRLATKSGKHIRKTTKVIAPDGRSVTFMGRLGKKKAIEQAKNIL